MLALSNRRDGVSALGLTHSLGLCAVVNVVKAFLGRRRVQNRFLGHAHDAARPRRMLGPIVKSSAARLRAEGSIRNLRLEERSIDSSNRQLGDQVAHASNGKWRESHVTTELSLHNASISPDYQHVG